MKNKYLFIFPLLVATLVGCDFFGTTVIHPSSKFVPTSIEPISPYQPDSGTGYEKRSDFAFNLQDVKKSNDQIPLSSVGDSYLLVVPVVFKDAPSWTSSKLNVLEKAFFGKAEDTAWQSVSSFYESSSYGKLRIKGEIAPVLQISDCTVSDASKHLDNDKKPAPDDLVLDYFIGNSSYDTYRKNYDKNGDGYIDSVAFIYSNSIDSDNGYWAWVYWDQQGGEPSVESPIINSYLWMSYDFFVDSNYAGYGSSIDCHTAIHETGHLLGLDDYYQYDEKEKFDPSGALEMHSYNIGDENIYSKFALGWVNPYYVKLDNPDDNVTLTLRTSALYGDAILIKDTWSGTALDEYIIVEYYSPYGMNEMDANVKYLPNGNSANLMYTISGFRIYHIDARICTLGVRGGFENYVNTLPPNKNCDVAASNSPSRSKYGENDLRRKNFKYVHLLESSGINSFKTGKTASNSTLYKKDSEFVATSEFFANGSKFNCGEEVGYRISVGECGDTVGTVTIAKI